MKRHAQRRALWVPRALDEWFPLVRNRLVHASQVKLSTGEMREDRGSSAGPGPPIHFRHQDNVARATPSCLSHAGSSVDPGILP